MNEKKARGLVAVAIAAALALGSIGVAAAATSSTETSSAAGTAATDAQRPDGPGGHGGPGVATADKVAGGVLAEALADLTDGDASDYMSQRAEGTSFADIAKAEGVSTDDLIAEAVKIETEKLDAALEDGTITQDEYDSAVANLDANLTEELTETHEIGGRGGHGAPDDATAPTDGAADATS